MASNELDLSDDMAKKAEREFKTSGFTGLTNFLSAQLDTWKTMPLRIAVIGSTKSGKSSFINAIRGLTPRDKGAAEVGVCEVTIEIKEYPSPDNPNLIYVDVPGVGTPSFPPETYLDQIKMDQFDFYIIVSCDTFTSCDAWLVREIKQRRKNFIFLRTKIDIDLRNQEEDFKDTYSEKDTLETIRKNCGRKGIEGKHIYLVSNRATTRWDFPFVRETLVTDFPKRKQDALVLSLRLAIGDRRNMILLKKDALQRRIAKISLASAAGGAIPIPGVCALFDLPIFLGETLVYRRQLGLDSESIQKLSSQSGIDLESLTTIASMAKKYTPDLLLKTFGTSVVGYVARDVVKVIPILGSIVGGLLSYDLCTEILSHILDDYTLVALSMNEYIYKHLKGEKCDVKEFMAKNKMPIEELTEDKVESAQDAKGAYELPEASTETNEKSSEHYVEKGTSEETTSLKDQNMPSGEIAGAVTEDNIESMKDAKRSDERREASTETNEKASDHGEEKGTSEETTSLKDQNMPSGEIAGANETSSEPFVEKGTSEEIASLRNQTMTNENEMASSEIRHAHQIKCFQFI